MGLNEVSTISLINSMSSQFTKTDWKIYYFLKQNSKQFIDMSAVEIASKTETSDASVIRFAQKLGFNGLYELKIQLKRDLNTGQVNETKQTGQLETDYLLAIKRVIEALDKEKLDTFNNLFKQANKIYVCSFKKNNFITNLFVDKFLTLGINVIPISNNDELKLYSAYSTKDDLFVIFCQGGDWDVIYSQMNSIKQRQGKIITIADTKHKKTKKLIDLEIFSLSTADLLSEIFISSSVLLGIIIDIMYQSVFHSDIDLYAFNLMRSLELTEKTSDMAYDTTLNKVAALINKK